MRRVPQFEDAFREALVQYPSTLVIDARNWTAQHVEAVFEVFPNSPKPRAVHEDMITSLGLRKEDFPLVRLDLSKMATGIVFSAAE